MEVTWHEGMVDRSKIYVRLDFDPEHTWPKKGLRYAQFEQGLCFPVPADLEAKALVLWLDAAQSTIEALHNLEGLDVHSTATWPLLSNGWIDRSRSVAVSTSCRRPT